MLFLYALVSDKHRWLFVVVIVMEPASRDTVESVIHHFVGNKWAYFMHLKKCMMIIFICHPCCFSVSHWQCTHCTLYNVHIPVHGGIQMTLCALLNNVTGLIHNIYTTHMYTRISKLPFNFTLTTPVGNV